MYKCDYCSKEYNILTGLCKHYFRKHNLTCKDYYDKHIRRPGEGICPVCGKETNFLSSNRGYNKYCSRKCAANDETYKNNKIANCLKKYGVRSTNDLPEVKKKKLKSRLDKNGGVFWTDEEKKRIKETAIVHYGGFGLASPELLKRARATNMQRYGKISYSQTNEFKEKLKNGEFGYKSEKTKESIKQTCLAKYGVSSYSKTQEFKEKFENTSLKKYGVKNPMQNHDVLIKSKKKYFFENRYFDSAPEICYYIWLRDNNKNFEYKPNISYFYIFNGKIKKYNPDFRVENEFVEIKGLHFFLNCDDKNRMINPFTTKLSPEKVEYLNDMMEAKHQCMIKNNIKIITDYEQYEKYVYETYGNNYLEQFRKNNA